MNLSRFLILTLIVAAATYLSAGLSVNHSDEYQMHLTFHSESVDLSNQVLADGNTYQRLVTSGTGALEPGQPDLPASAFWLLVPNGTTPLLNIQADKEIIYENVMMAPVPQPAMDLLGAAEPEFFLDEELYNRNSQFPGYFARLEPIMKKRSQDCTILWIFPYQYNPVTKTLTLYQYLDISIVFSGNIQPLPANVLHQDYVAEVTALAINGSEVLQAEMEETSLRQQQYREDGCDLLIITPPDFSEAAQILAAWKREIGYLTTIATTEETGNTYNSINTFINYAYANWDPAPRFLLLFGDAEFLPPPYITPHPATGEGQGYTAADMYYADVDEPGDLVADMAFGRLPIETTLQAEQIVNRIIEYECNPPTQPHYYQNVTCAAYFQEADGGNGIAERRFAKTSEDVRNFLSEKEYATERIYYTGFSTYPQYWNNTYYVFENDISGGPLPQELLKPEFPWNGSNIDINNAINNGTFFVVHRDHGSRLGWGEPSYNIYDIQSLNNGSLRPVIFTINCNTGWFDNETDADECSTQPYSESFVEYFLRHHSGGSIGLVGSTRISYSGNNDRLMWGFMDAIWPDFLEWCTATYPPHEPFYRMGDVVNYGKEYMMLNYTWGNETRRVSLEEFLWFGDPTMQIWTAYPQELAAVYDPAIELGASSLNIECYVEGARVTLSRSGELIATSTFFNDQALLTFPPVTEVEELLLTVHAHNYLPLRGIIEVIPTGAYLVCDQVQFSETGGYPDGVIQSLDQVEIGFTLENIGIMPTSGDVTLTLTTSSTHVEILNDTNTTGIIPDSTTLEISNAFLIRLYQGIPDSTMIPFTLHMETDSSNWQSNFDLLVSAPVLEFVNYRLELATPGDEILDPGETAELYLTYTNSGSGYSYSTFTTLFSNDPYLTVSGMDMIDQIPPASQQETLLPFLLVIAPECPVDHYIEINVLALDEVGAVLNTTISIPVGLLVYNFDGGAPLWESAALAEGYLNQWHLSSYRNHSELGQLSMKCGGPDGEYFSNNVFAALYMPTFTAASGTFLRFFHWLETGIMINNNSWDGGIIEISVDGGEFQQIEPIGGYPATLLNLPTLPFPPGIPVFAGSIDWEEVELDLSPYEGQVQLRFVFGSSPTQYTREGWYIDDIRIVNLTGSEEQDLAPASTLLLGNYPNPFNPQTTVSFQLAEAGYVNLEIYNLKGQKVVTLQEGELAAGIYHLPWNGWDRLGRKASSGIYFCRLQTADGVDVRKMVLMK